MSQATVEHQPTSPAGEPSGHDPHLAHHFDTPAQQTEAATLGMWLFLATEILLFGGLFCAYAVYRANHPEIFEYAHTFLSKPLGATNTVILLTSSFTMAAGVWAAAHGRQRMLKIMLALTILCACGFLSIKYIEYKHKWEEGLLWGARYKPHSHDIRAAEEHRRTGDHPAPTAPGVTVAPETRVATAPATTGDNAWTVPLAPPGPAGLARGAPPAVELVAERKARNVQLFFSIYFGMTGLHGLHVIAGMAAIGWILTRATRGDFSPAYYTPVAMVGLYWHVVDLIWIYLFPLLYLIH